MSSSGEDSLLDDVLHWDTVPPTPFDPNRNQRLFDEMFASSTASYAESMRRARRFNERLRRSRVIHIDVSSDAGNSLGASDTGNTDGSSDGNSLGSSDGNSLGSSDGNSLGSSSDGSIESTSDSNTHGSTDSRVVRQHIGSTVSHVTSPVAAAPITPVSTPVSASIDSDRTESTTLTND
jgi:hypothetical protein